MQQRMSSGRYDLINVYNGSEKCRKTDITLCHQRKRCLFSYGRISTTRAADSTGRAGRAPPGRHDWPVGTIAPSRPQSTTAGRYYVSTTSVARPAGALSSGASLRRPGGRPGGSLAVQDSCGSVSWTIDCAGRRRRQRRACLRVISICYTT